MRFLMAVLMLSWLFGCASNGTGTLGNGRIDINFGDGKLFGSERAYLIAISAAQFAVYKNPTLAFSAKRELANARDSVAETVGEYPPEKAGEIVFNALREECGFYCRTVAGQAYLEQYIQLAAESVDEISTGVTVSPVALIDELIAQIEAVEASVK